MIKLLNNANALAIHRHFILTRVEITCRMASDAYVRGLQHTTMHIRRYRCWTRGIIVATKSSLNESLVGTGPEMSTLRKFLPKWQVRVRGRRNGWNFKLVSRSVGSAVKRFIKVVARIPVNMLIILQLDVSLHISVLICNYWKLITLRYN